MLYCTGYNLSWMIKFSIFCEYTAQKLAQLGKKIAQARLPRLPLFPSLGIGGWYSREFQGTGMASQNWVNFLL